MILHDATIRSYSRDLTRFAQRFTSLADAQDVVQDAFLQLCLCSSDLQNPRAWLFTVVRHRLANRWKHAARRERLAGDVARLYEARAPLSGEQVFMRRVMRASALAAVRELPGDARHAVCSWALQRERGARGRGSEGYVTLRRAQRRLGRAGRVFAGVAR